MTPLPEIRLTGAPIPCAPGCAPGEPPKVAAATTTPVPASGKTAPGAEAVFYSEDDFQRQLMKEGNAVPGSLLALCALGALAIYGTRGYAADAVLGAATMIVVSGLLVGLSVVLGAALGWLVSKMFQDVPSTAGALLVRFGSIAAAHFPLCAGLRLGLDDVPAFFAAVPALFVLSVVAAGMSLGQGLVYIAMLSVVLWGVQVVLRLAEVGAVFA